MPSTEILIVLFKQTLVQMLQRGGRGGAHLKAGSHEHVVQNIEVRASAQPCIVRVVRIHPPDGELCKINLFLSNEKPQRELISRKPLTTGQ
jgi:hypothetical protein